MGARERRFEHDGLTLAALEWPGEGVPILALHGWLDNAASFAPLAGSLQGRPLLALDLPGHGRSGHLPPSARYHLADNLFVLAAVADAMGWPRFILLGHSLGAAVACLAAAAMPTRVAALSLLDGLGPIAYTPALEVARLRELFDEGEAGEREKSPRPFADLATAVRIRRRYSRYPIGEEAATPIVERSLQRVEGGYVWCYDARLKGPSSHYYSEEQVRGILGAIECPALLLSAEKGALAGWRGFAERRAALPGLLYEVLPGGHHLHMEQPQAVAERLCEFYRTVEGAGR